VEEKQPVVGSKSELLHLVDDGRVMSSDFDVDVLIIGAGMAGLTAARTLAERNISVRIVEARERVGGRVFSVPVEGGGVAELGAEFVHGCPPELWALIDESGMKTVEREGSMLREQPGGELVEDDPEDSGMFQPLEELETLQGEDAAFADWLKASAVPEEDRAALTGYVEGFNAADAARISVKSLGIQQRAEDANEGDRSSHVVGGYQQLAEYLAARVKELGAEVRLGCEVKSITWTDGRVAVETWQEKMLAKRCIVTLPLSVVQQTNQAGSLTMEPEPKAVPHARRMAMGHATRFTMVFRERWWEQSGVLERDALAEMSFLFTSERMPPVWWTSTPEKERFPSLTGWVGGPRAKLLEGKSAEELGLEACTQLAEVFAVSEDLVRAALISTHTHDWAGDRYSLGAYSYVPVGAIDASAAMCVPEAATMYFAGEHTDTSGHWGTVHAAMRSGLRAAAQILNED
jgi:monoamine oxidase